MSASVAFVFPGQGSQAVGMGRALFDAFAESRAVFQAADDALGEPLSRACFEGPEDVLRRTATTQPAILTVSVAAHAALRARLDVRPVLLAGHSLGEYSALVAAGALALPDAVRAVRARGTFMQEAVPEGVGAMAAVLGLEAKVVDEVCAAASGAELVACANFNEPGQTVIAGHAPAVARAGELLKQKGARRVLPLPVSAPFHCPLMAPVVDRLAPVLSGVELRPLIAPVVSNVEASPNDAPSRVVELLLRQVTAPVRWVETVAALEAAGVTHVVELGPGKVLCGLVKRCSGSLTCLNVEDPASLDRTLAALEGAHG